MIDNIIELLRLSIFFVGGCFILGLLVGSFLNVVIYRLPLIIEDQWFANVSLILTDALSSKKETGIPLIDDSTSNEVDLERKGGVKGYSFLAWPPSECPNCGYSIKTYQNIPVISWLFLRGKCAGCRNPISIRYPVIELLTGLLTGLIAYRYGFSYATFGYILLSWALIALTFIDFEHYILPDEITIPGIWIGLILAFFEVLPITFESAFYGAIVGYLFFWTINWGFKIFFKKNGMGYGDFKLLSLLGAWLGLSSIFPIVLLSTVVGSIVGISLLLFFKHAREKPIPFGPYLAIAGLLYLFFNQEILAFIPLLI